MKMYVLDNGMQTIDKSIFLGGYSLATPENTQPKHELIDIPIHTFLIEHDGNYILYDTAADVDWEKNWPEHIAPYVCRPEQLLPNALARLGVKPEQVRTVVMSHLHADHCGCLPLFTKAKVYVNNEEFVTSLRQYAIGRDLDVHVASDIKAILDAGLDWRPVMAEEKEIELIPGVKILNFGSGHAWGMLGLHVCLPSGRSFLIVADAIYFAESIRDGIRLPLNLYDSLGFIRTAKFIQDYAAKHKAEILFGHDRKQFDTLIHSDQGWYD